LKLADGEDSWFGDLEAASNSKNNERDCFPNPKINV
jgi:hypothetical protein